MYSQDFCYWLQGYFEISGAEELNKEQIEIIKNHLNLVFRHEIDPQHEGDPVELQNIHDGNNPQWPHPAGDPLVRC